MDRITAIELAMKASILAGKTKCTVDEAIRFLAAIYVLRERTIERICEITQLNRELVRNLIEADYLLNC